MVLRFCSKVGKTPWKLLLLNVPKKPLNSLLLTFLANQKQGIQMLQGKNKNR